jgi:CheY-like chemotaxis protein
MDTTGTPIPILHVEDDENDIYLVRHVFKRGAPRAVLHVAHDGEEAVAYLAGHAPFQDRSRFPLPRLVLMDLKLPKKTGFEVIQWVNARPALKDIPLYILSSSSEKVDLDRATEAGVTGYLVKPGSLDELANVLSEIFDYVRNAPNL